MNTFHSIVEAVLHHASTMADKLCLCEPANAVTYRQEAAAIMTLSRQLKNMGIGRGDYVVIRNGQDIRTMTAILAVQLVGGISVPVEKNIQQGRIQEICERTGAKAVIAAKDPEVGTTWINLKEIKLCHEADAAKAAEAAETGQADGIFAENVPAEPAGDLPQDTDTAEILFTTGTTGKSKGIEITHRAIVAVCENVIDGVEMQENNVEMIPVPISHSHGLRRTYSNLLMGGTVVLIDGVVFVNQLFKAIEKYGVNAIDLVPSALSAVLRFGKGKLGEYKDKIRYVQLGSAPIPEADRAALRELLPQSRLYNFYGTTESGCSCILDFNKYPDLKSCIGMPVVNAEFGFFREDGSRAAGTKEDPGVLGCRGDMNMTGYMGEPELNKAVFNEGFIVSQDLSYMDEEGRIYLMGRQGEVIVSGGAKIAPSEVEDAAGKVEGVVECACIPVEDAILGQVPKLFYATDLKLAETADASTDTAGDGLMTAAAFEKKIYDELSKVLEDYKVPRLYERLQALPRTYNGKILRRELINR